MKLSAMPAVATLTYVPFSRSSVGSSIYDITKHPVTHLLQRRTIFIALSRSCLPILPKHFASLSPSLVRALVPSRLMYLPDASALLAPLPSFVPMPTPVTSNCWADGALTK
jgi:hypothetical protein